LGGRRREIWADIGFRGVTQSLPLAVDLARIGGFLPSEQIGAADLIPVH